ncbi:MAG: hypothetical protein ACOWWO_16015 [Peptococcaceae bacterium]
MKRKIYRDTFGILQSILYTIIGLFLLNLAPDINISGSETQVIILMLVLGAIMYIRYSRRKVELDADKLVIKSLRGLQTIKLAEISKIVLSKKLSITRIGYKQEICIFGKESNEKLAAISSDIIGGRKLAEFINILLENSGAIIEEKKETLQTGLFR